MRAIVVDEGPGDDEHDDYEDDYDDDEDESYEGDGRL